MVDEKSSRLDQVLIKIKPKVNQSKLSIDVNIFRAVLNSFIIANRIKPLQKKTPLRETRDTKKLLQSVLISLHTIMILIVTVMNTKKNHSVTWDSIKRVSFDC